MSMAITKPKKTTEQRMADHAWKVVERMVKEHAPKVNGKRQPNEAAKKFGTHAKKLPVRIMASGLGQALAFLLAKGYAPDLLKAVGDWVLDKRANPDSKRPEPADDALLRSIVDGTHPLRRATDETLAYLQWLNRFVEAEGLTEE